jgi:hypothetical protein
LPRHVARPRIEHDPQAGPGSRPRRSRSLADGSSLPSFDARDDGREKSSLAQAARRSASISAATPSNWFQLAEVRLTAITVQRHQ